MEIKGFSQFEIIINVSVIALYLSYEYPRVYGQYIFFNSFRRLILKSEVRPSTNYVYTRSLLNAYFQLDAIFIWQIKHN